MSLGKIEHKADRCSDNIIAFPTRCRLRGDLQHPLADLKDILGASNNDIRELLEVISKKFRNM